MSPRRMSVSFAPVTGLRRRPTRYDLVLAVIPAAFVLVGLLAIAGALQGPAAVVAASLVGVLAMVDALFLNPPDGRAGGRTGV